MIDATYFGKREEKFGVLVAKDALTMQPVAFRFIRTETLKEYEALRKELEAKRFQILAVTVDGRRGLYGLFEDLPIQMCHFHQQQILIRYLTRNPQSEAAQNLKKIAASLGRVSACRFSLLLDAWYRRYRDYYEERTPDESKRGWHYKHKRLRSAYRSLRNNLPYLFTYRTYPELNIPNTTNALDGGCFAPMKMLLKIHRGIGLSVKKKLIIDFILKRMNQQHENDL